MNDFLRDEPPDVVMVILDAMNLERSLYLLLETLERYRKVMVVLNKLDMAQEREVAIYHDRLEAELQVPVLPEIVKGRLNTQELFATVLAMADSTTPLRSYAIRYAEHIEQQLSDRKDGAVDGPVGSARWRTINSLSIGTPCITSSPTHARKSAFSSI